MEQEPKFFLLSRRFWTVAGIPVILAAVEVVRWFVPEAPLPNSDVLMERVTRFVDAILSGVEYGSPLVAMAAYYMHKKKPDTPEGPRPLTIRPWKPRVPGPK